ncbi:MAG: HlyD family efflux transporter periplasmic adaptor subunit [Cyanobacteria bacterium P01_D01_bin.115]
MEQSSDIGRSWFFLSHRRWFIGLGFACVLLVGGIVYISRKQPEELPVASSVPSPIPTTVNALGRLEPANGVIQVSASSNQAVANRVAELRVGEGDQVQAGQVIAVLNSRDRLQAALAEANQQVRLAETRLAQVQSATGAEAIAARRAVVARLEAQLAGEIQAQQAVGAGLEAEVENARVDLQRSRSLFAEGAIAEATLDTQLLALETAQEALNEQTARTSQLIQTLAAQIREARAILDQEIAVQPQDIAVAQAEVEQAIASANRLQAELETAFIRAPSNAQVLAIQTLVGETISDDGIVELGDTAQMIVVAEVFESDIDQVRQGQRAVASSPTGVFSETLTGTVEEIGLKVATRDVLDTTPTAATDARVIEVRIRLDERSIKIANGLTNLQVNVEIQPEE